MRRLLFALLFAWAVFAVQVLGGCDNSVLNACNDTVDVLTARVVACSPGADPVETRRQLELSATMSQKCDRVVMIRNESELRNSCLPALRELTCAQLSAGMIPASCREQLQVVVNR